VPYGSAAASLAPDASSEETSSPVGAVSAAASKIDVEVPDEPLPLEPTIGGQSKGAHLQHPSRQVAEWNVMSPLQLV
jgi:hypothetical protein